MLINVNCDSEMVFLLISVNVLGDRIGFSLGLYGMGNVWMFL